MPTKKCIISLSIIVFALNGCYNSQETKRIGILMWSEGLVGYRQALQGIRDGLRDSGYREGLNLEITYRNAEGKDAEAKKIVEEYVRAKPDVLVTIGSAAYLTAVEGTKGTDIPVVFSVVSYPREALEQKGSAKEDNATGVTISISPDIYFDKLKKILPRARRVGILSVNKYATSAASAKMAFLSAPKFGLIPFPIELMVEELDRIEGIIGALSAKPDAIFIPADPILYEEGVMKKIIPPMARLKIPVILISENYLKYGALFALNGDFYKLGRQTVACLLKIFDGVRPADIRSDEPLDVRFTLNKKAAEELGLKPGWNIIAEADSIME